MHAVRLHSSLRVAHAEGFTEFHAAQTIIAPGGEWVQYSTPGEEGAEYIAVCLPAFAPDLVHRDE